MDRFFAAERFRRTPAAFRPHLEEAEWLPNVKLADVRPPRKTTPVRRLTVNRKPLRNHGSLAQPPISGNGLYSTAGHLVESDRLPQGRRASPQKHRGLPCLTAGTASSPSRRIPFNT